MDDMVDMAMDIRTRKHNYVVSLVHHNKSNPAEKERLTNAMKPDRNAGGGTELATRFPIAHPWGRRPRTPNSPAA